MKRTIPSRARRLFRGLGFFVLLSGALRAQNDPWVAPPSADALQNPLKGDAAATAVGEQLFKTICFVCHGNQGKGDGINAPSLAKKPADLTSRRVQRQSDGALFWKISEGNPPMLTFKNSLSEEQRWSLVNYVRKLGELYGEPSGEESVAGGNGAAAPSTGTSNAKRVEAETRAMPSRGEHPTLSSEPEPLPNPFAGMTDGKELFRNICGACHTVGKGKLIGPDLKDVHQRHSRDWLFRWIRSSQSLVQAGDPEAVELFNAYNQVVMPDQPFLEDAQIAAILDYIAEAGKPAVTRAPGGRSTRPSAAVQGESWKAPKGKTFGQTVFGKLFLWVGFLLVFVTLLVVPLVLTRMFRDSYRG